jgi:hypothetical protein
LGTGIIPTVPKVLLIISFANGIDGFNTGFAIGPLCELVLVVILGLLLMLILLYRRLALLDQRYILNLLQLLRFE